jgi:hypothetical protein
MDDDDIEYPGLQSMFLDSNPSLTEEQMRRLWQADRPISPTGRTPQQPPIQTGGRRTGTQHPRQLIQQLSQLQQGRLSLDLRALEHTLELVRNEVVVVWRSNNRFTYAAVFARTNWFITGSGVFYGKNEFTHHEFVFEVLGNKEVTNLWFTDRFTEIYRR